MFIVVKHQIQNSKAFFEKGTDMTKRLPKDVRVDFFLPDKDMKSAVCLWEADSVERVRSILDKEVPYSENTYYEVDATKAMGLERFSLAASR